MFSRAERSAVLSGEYFTKIEDGDERRSDVLYIKKNTERKFCVTAIYATSDGILFGKVINGKHLMLTLIEYRDGALNVGSWSDGYQLIWHNIGDGVPESIHADLDHKRGWVYLVKSSAHFKIGHTKDMKQRSSFLKINLPEQHEILHMIKCEDRYRSERYWHDRFKEKRLHGEWFCLNELDIYEFQTKVSM